MQNYKLLWNWSQGWAFLFRVQLRLWTCFSSCVHICRIQITNLESILSHKMLCTPRTICNISTLYKLRYSDKTSLNSKLNPIFFFRFFASLKTNKNQFISLITRKKYSANDMWSNLKTNTNTYETTQMTMNWNNTYKSLITTSWEFNRAVWYFAFKMFTLETDVIRHFQMQLVLYDLWKMWILNLQGHSASICNGSETKSKVGTIVLFLGNGHINTKLVYFLCKQLLINKFIFYVSLKLHSKATKLLKQVLSLALVHG